jgi:hypothetical protein
MKYVVLILSLLLIGCGATYPSYEPEPQPQTQQQEQVAELSDDINWLYFGVAGPPEEGEPAYIYFYSSNLDSGRMNVTLNDQRVVEMINKKFTPYKLDVDTASGKEVAKMLLGHANTPSHLVIVKEEKDLEFYELHGYLPVNDFLRATSPF